MEKEKIDRINELARLKKERGLSPEELNEQAVLRRQYIEEYKENVRATLKRVRVEQPDGTMKELKAKDKSQK